MGSAVLLNCPAPRRVQGHEPNGAPRRAHHPELNVVQGVVHGPPPCGGFALLEGLRYEGRQLVKDLTVLISMAEA